MSADALEALADEDEDDGGEGEDDPFGYLEDAAHEEALFGDC